MQVRRPRDYFTLFSFEVLGTAVLTMAVNFGYKLHPDIVCSGLFVAILLTFRITGSHLNGGITLGVFIFEWRNSFLDEVHGGEVRKKKRHIALTYVAAQLVGSYLGMVASYIITGDDMMDMVPKTEMQNVFYTMLVEFIFSWIFITIYLHAKCDWVAPS
jgi:glycerol uptake facilitator-like aquaporin